MLECCLLIANYLKLLPAGLDISDVNPQRNTNRMLLPSLIFERLLAIMQPDIMGHIASMQIILNSIVQ